MSEICVNGQIFKKWQPDVKIFSLDGQEIVVSEMILSGDGQILAVKDQSGNEFFRENFNVCTTFLEVPGVGFLKPGTGVRIDGQEYILNYGDHTNISNQRLISWYLTPANVSSAPDPLGRITSEDRTLYKEMIDQIDLITV